MSKIMAEYIWLDGVKPTSQLRSKTKIIEGHVSSLADIPEWGFDGSSTQQAEGHFSDCLLRPVSFFKDPLRGEPHILVMCEVFNADGSVHPSNTRSHLRDINERYLHEEAWFGIEQEFILMQSGKPAGWPKGGFPKPQGDFYCGVGIEAVSGRELVEAHMQACLDAGLRLCGTNAEVMLGQWEFQVGPLPPLQLSDEMWIARWLLLRLGEEYGYGVSLDPKPVKGDWNGSGGHTNFSTKAIRAPGGLAVIEAACKKLGERHDAHIAVYGADNEQRLTGKHETCGIKDFKYGVSHRGASIRIPMASANNGCGYLEDRRPAANADPYQVCAAIVETACRQ